MPITIKAKIISPVVKAGTKPRRRSHRHPERLSFHNVRPRSTAAKLMAMPVPPRRTAPAPLFPVDEELVEFDEDPVPLICFALSSKASKVFALDSFAFAAKTIPSPQWPLWRQYAQIGEESFTWTVYVGKVVAFVLTGILTKLRGVSNRKAHDRR